MRWGTAVYWGLRAVLAVASGGASEAGFVAADAVGVAFAGYELANAISDLAGQCCEACPRTAMHTA